MNEYNLITEPWITCLDKNGAVRDLGLGELFAKAHQLKGLDSPYPIVNAALMRLLLAILTRSLAPDSYKSWQGIMTAGSFNMTAIEAYLQKRHSRFNLFDQSRPFYQASDERVNPKPVLKLLPHLASGNNAVLFDHNTEESGLSLSPAEAACFVVALQSYGLGGLSGIAEKFTAAPAARGISFFVEGENLFETLALNLIKYTGEDNSPIPSHPDDAPAWEMEDPFAKRDKPRGLLDYLTWQNRRVLLIPEEISGQLVVRQMTEAPGLRMDEKFIDGIGRRDPYQYYRVASSGDIIVMRFSASRALWRSSAALLRFQGDMNALKPPRNLGWLSELTVKGLLQKKRTYRLNAIGMAADKSKVLFYRSESLPLPLVYLEDTDLIKDLEYALLWADYIAGNLNIAVRHLAETMISFAKDNPEGRTPFQDDWKKLRQHLGADPIFWSRLELPFHQLVEALPQRGEAALEDWKTSLEHSAKIALEHAIDMCGDNLVAWRAQVGARSILFAGLKKYHEQELPTGG